MAQAVLLTPKEVSNYYRQQEILSDPETRTLTDLFQQMADVFQKDNLTNFQKIQLYENIIRRFQKIKDSILRKQNPFSNYTQPTFNPTPQPTEPTMENDSVPLNEMYNLLNKLQTSINEAQPSPRKRKKLTATTPHPSRLSTTSSPTYESDLSAYNTPQSNSPPQTTPQPSTTSSAATATSTPTSTHQQQQQTKPISPNMTTRAKNLHKILTRDSSFAQALEEKNLDPTAQILHQTLNALTNPNINSITTVPNDVKKLAQYLYSFIVKNNISLPVSYNKLPLYNMIQHEFAKHKSPKTRLSKSLINFKTWDKNEKK